MSRYALISVWDKTGLDRLVPQLVKNGWTILSTGGTAQAIKNSGFTVIEVSDFTGFPEILDGRVKTLHPKIFAGILAKRNATHEKVLEEMEIPQIDLVVVNLYPFRQTIAKEGVTLAEAIEQIDIGGPSLVRAAAKNHDRVSVLVDPDDYERIAADLTADGVSDDDRRQLAVKAFRHTAAYDAAIAAHLPALITGERPATGPLIAEALLSSEEQALRYGENPHQWGVLARCLPGRGLASARQIQGKALSYNNFGDATGAWRLVWDLPGAGVAIIKHANPCGVGLGEDMVEAFRIARGTDPLSAFGGVIVANRKVDRAFAEAVIEQFAEVVVAPEFGDDALAIFAKKKNLRVLEAAAADPSGVIVRAIDGGFILQEADFSWQGEARNVVTARQPSDEEMQAMELAWRVVKHVSSNAIVVGKNGALLGIGAGQMSRVDAAKIAVAKAIEMKHDLSGSVAASDAFFPFPDGIETLNAAGVTAVIQPGGSIRDSEVIEACDRLGMTMVLTGRRHFRH